MTPCEAIVRREKRVDQLIDRVESGDVLTSEDWQRLDQLNVLDLMSVEQGATREILNREDEADGVTVPNE